MKVAELASVEQLLDQANRRAVEEGMAADQHSLAPASEIAAMLVEPILADLPFTKGDPVIAFVNGLGGTPLIELYVMFNEVNKILAGHGVSVARSLVGNYITSLDMAGASITLLKVDDELLSLWDAPVNTAALRWGI